MNKRDTRIGKFLTKIAEETNDETSGIVVLSNTNHYGGADNQYPNCGSNTGSCENYIASSCARNYGNCDNYDGVCLGSENSYTCRNLKRNTNLYLTCIK